MDRGRGSSEEGRELGRRGIDQPTLRELLAPPRPALRAWGWAIAIVGTAGLVTAFLPYREDVSTVSLGFGFLAAVVAAAALGGLWPGLVASVGGFIVYNYFFLPPYGTFVINDWEHVVVLFVFLGISLVITLIVARSRERAAAAEAREAELRALQELSSDLVRLGPGVETYEGLLARVAELFGFDAAALYVPDDKEPSGLRKLVVIGDADRGAPTWDPSSAAQAPERLPLVVGSRHLGLIVLRGERPPLGPAESRILRSFCDQLALVLERDRLQRDATDAEVYRRGEGMRRALLAAVSHDLRSPLAAIKASVTDLLDPTVRRPDDDRDEVLRTIDRESDRLNALIADLLDMSRIEAGKLKAHLVVVEIREVLTHCLKIVGREHPDAGSRVMLMSDVHQVRGDPVLLERVVVNLLSNAVDASDGSERTSVELRTKPVAERLIIRVVDHGRGIDANGREQLFYPFYRLDERNPRLGSGLGLAICKGYIEAMNGEIWVEDTPGGGATFAFALPRAESGT